jgi:NADH-quinone oxidoreductase subunit M
MILPWFILVPLIAGAGSWLLAWRNESWARWSALVGSVVNLALAVLLWVGTPKNLSIIGQGAWLAEIRWAWIPSLGISLHLAADGLSLLMVTLTAFLGLMGVIASWNGIRERIGFFHLNLLLVLAGITGVFLSLDLFLFYFFWELMLVPMFFLINIWGHEHRHYAAVKFFLFTQLGGLLMLVSIIALALIHGRASGRITFDYTELLGTPLSGSVAYLLMLGFLAAFLVKLPAVPFHPWLPDAHTEAPTAGSVILAGLLLKTGAYGLLRFVIPLFPAASASFAPVAMILGVIGILYGASLAFAQTDLKRLVAYTSVSHLGFVLIGVFAFNELALQGAVMQMVCHGISTGALFILVGALQDRLGTRDVQHMGGLWSNIPVLGGVMMVFALASLGLPGLGNFVAEFLVLLGTFQVSVPIASVTAVGLVVATVYSIWMIFVTFFGRAAIERQVDDLRLYEKFMMTAMIVVIVWLGLFPQPVLNLARPAVQRIIAVAMNGGSP